MSRDDAQAAGRLRARRRRVALGRDGKKYLDALAGIAVNNGLPSAKLKKALTERINSGVLHTSNLWRIPDQEKAADRIAEITGLDEVFFCNSGLEANEARSRWRASTATTAASPSPRSS